MANKIQCIRCHGWKRRRKGTIDGSKKTYTCLSCRWLDLAKLHFPKIVVRTKSYRALRSAVLKQVRMFETSTEMAPEDRQRRFILGIKTIMDQNFIRDYKFNILDNKLKSITIYNLPIIGQLDIPIYETKK